MSFGSFLGDTFEFLGTHPGQVLADTGGQLRLSVAAVVVSAIIAVPIGATVGHLHKGSFVAINGSNVLRALPTLAIIGLYLSFSGGGFDNLLVALVILGLPLILTNTYVGVAGVDPGAVEAARGMGMTGLQILLRVELPNAIRLVMTGVRTATVFIIATAYLGNYAFVSDTYGDVITNPTLPKTQLLAYTILSVVLAFVADGVLAVVQRLLTPKGVKLTTVSAAT